MKKIMLIFTVPALAMVIWQSAHLSSPVPSPSTARTPQSAEEYHQAGGSWDEQISAIKREYGLDKPKAVHAVADATLAVSDSAVAQTLPSTGAPTTMADTSSDAPAPAQPYEQSALQDAVFDRAAQAFGQEPVDEIWAQQSSQQIADYFAELSGADSPASILNNVECRSSRCKVEVLHEDLQALEDFALRFPLSVTGALHNMMFHTEELPDGRIAVVMYLEE